ncbi:hypothetical protein SAMN05444483_105131 [Salegentibacter echinorum]|uniref:Uncharacterized protein n=1 Tax=Salegentibacter echinorum TaxID=1073325 RepID=A0A1M5HG30_SALEC|nr:hypothetical protein SAMN05444483_105131 [Salegentibacter echinorum]
MLLESIYNPLGIMNKNVPLSIRSVPNNSFFNTSVRSLSNCSEPEFDLRKARNHPFFSEAEFIPSLPRMGAGLSGYFVELKALLPFKGKVASSAIAEEVGRVDM